MSERSQQQLIETMLECIDHIELFIGDYSFDAFYQDIKTSAAVLRKLEVLGEAANRVPKELKEKYPHIEWGRIIRSRNLIAHEYEIIDYSVIWRIVSAHLPPLKLSLKKILKDLES
jgi:uncharacterized protein with HEPN domain